MKVITEKRLKECMESVMHRNCMAEVTGDTVSITVSTYNGNKKSYSFSCFNISKSICSLIQNTDALNEAMGACETEENFSECIDDEIWVRNKLSILADRLKDVVYIRKDDHIDAVPKGKNELPVVIDIETFRTNMEDIFGAENVNVSKDAWADIMRVDLFADDQQPTSFSFFNGNLNGYLKKAVNEMAKAKYDSSLFEAFLKIFSRFRNVKKVKLHVDPIDDDEKFKQLTDLLESLNYNLDAKGFSSSANIGASADGSAYLYLNVDPAETGIDANPFDLVADPNLWGDKDDGCKAEIEKWIDCINEKPCNNKAQKKLFTACLNNVLKQ